MIHKTSPQKQYFRSFDELAGKPQFDEAIDHDFGDAAPPPTDGMSRRRWLQLMGASMAFGSVIGCRMGEEVIAPFTFRPHNRQPGVPEQFATSFDFGGIGRPLLATCVDGRPIKLDGNSAHPNANGGSDAYTQALILELYDPDRSRTPRIGRSETGWEALLSEVRGTLGDGQGVAVLGEPTSSPTQGRLKAAFLEKYPRANWYEFSSLSDDNERQGTRLAFGQPYRQQYRFDEAAVIVTIDADPLGTDPDSPVNIRRFSAGRDADAGSMSRLYSVESKLTLTGALADHQLPVRTAQMPSFLAALEQAIDSGTAPPISGTKREKIYAAMIDDLLANRGRSILMGGRRLSPELHAQVCRINHKLDNLGKTIELSQLPDTAPRVEQISQLASSISGGDVQTLIILGGNPAYDAPADLGMAELIGQVENSVHFSYYENETSQACRMHGNLAHPLESWGDSVASDGSWLIAQPLIRPLFQGLSTIEVLDRLVNERRAREREMTSSESQAPGAAQAQSAAQGQNQNQQPGQPEGVMAQQIEKPGVNRFASADTGPKEPPSFAYEMIKTTAKETWDSPDFDRLWARSVHDGFIANSQVASERPSLASFSIDQADPEAWKSVWDGGNVELVFVPGSSTYDGRFANNGWLQELPDFLSKLTWDNAAHVSPKTARLLGLYQGYMATFNVGGRALDLPVNILPGMAHGTVAVELGYGRTRAGRVGGDAARGVAPVGQNAGVLRTTEHWNWAPDVTAQSTGRGYELATTQEHFRMDALGQQEINRRAYGETGDAPLIREGNFRHYMQWLQDHDLAAPGGGLKSGLTSNEHSAPRTDPSADNGANGHADSQADGQANGAEHNGGGGEHGGHKSRWPSDHHLHFKNVDITPHKYELDVQHKWGMSIDLNKCVGCNACVVACQAENNIPIVGKDQVLRGRELHWLRIDRYFVADSSDQDADDVKVAYQPVTCQQCENAPCETVCPVAATTHSREGLNDMVYNRCIGTRYCGNNCPYKVRRFNYLNYSEARTFIKYPNEGTLSKADRALKNLMMNPEVTIRSRGVMEKCTFCVQRIQNTKIEAKNESREIGPNEIKTACQEACPADAIKFGDLYVKESDVAKGHANPRAYVLLEEMNNYPRNRFLARVRNPHPALEIVETGTNGSNSAHSPEGSG